MDDFTNHSVKIGETGLTYSYWLSPFFNRITSASPDIPVLLFVHGFPDDAFMWAHTMKHLRTPRKDGAKSIVETYPIVCVDLLGFGGTSKPTDPNLYRNRLQANAIAQILDHLNIVGDGRVIPIGHDWGSGVSQRFYLWHSARCCGLALMSLAYNPPSDEHFDLDTVNEQTAKKFGYPQWEYWNFFCADDAPKLLKDRLDLFYEVNNGILPAPEEGHDDVWMREMFCSPGQMRAYMEGKWRGGQRVQLRPYPDLENDKKYFMDRLSKGGLEGPVLYYTSLRDNCNLEDETELVKKGAGSIHVPVLYIGQTGDWVCRTDLMEIPKEKGLLEKGYERRVINAGHWCAYEKPDEIAKHISEWVESNFPVEQ